VQQRPKSRRPNRCKQNCLKILNYVKKTTIKSISNRDFDPSNETRSLGRKLWENLAANDGEDGGVCPSRARDATESGLHAPQKTSACGRLEAPLTVVLVSSDSDFFLVLMISGSDDNPYI
jgi:hypothetical protein